MPNLAMRSAILAACLTAAACTDEQADGPVTRVDSGGTAGAAPAAASVPTLSAMTTSMEGVSESPLCALDAVNGTLAADSSFAVVSGQPITFEGWVARSNLQNPGTISIILDGQTDFEIAHVTGIARKDVAEAYGSAGLGEAGFRTELSMLEVPADRYSVMLGHDEDGTAFVCRTKLTLVVGQ